MEKILKNDVFCFIFCDFFPAFFLMLFFLDELSTRKFFAENWYFFRHQNLGEKFRGLGIMILYIGLACFWGSKF